MIIGGGKATGAVLTRGLSLFHTVLLRKVMAGGLLAQVWPPVSCPAATSHLT